MSCNNKISFCEICVIFFKNFSKWNENKWVNKIFTLSLRKVWLCIYSNACGKINVLEKLLRKVQRSSTFTMSQKTMSRVGTPLTILSVYQDQGWKWIMHRGKKENSVNYSAVQCFMGQAEVGVGSLLDGSRSLSHHTDIHPTPESGYLELFTSRGSRARESRGSRVIESSRARAVMVLSSRACGKLRRVLTRTHKGNIHTRFNQL